jgi:hypothetical protein
MKLSPSHEVGVELNGCDFSFVTERVLDRIVVHATASRGDVRARWQFPMPQSGDSEYLVEEIIYPAMWDFILMTEPAGDRPD